MSVKQVLHADSIGRFAFKELAQISHGELVGVTSKGIFIRTEMGGVVFVSREKFRGPLTVTLQEREPDFRTLQNGARVQLSSGLVELPGVQILLSLEETQVWHPPPKPSGYGSFESSISRMKTVFSQIAEMGASSSFLTCTMRILGLQRKKQSEEYALELIERMETLINAIRDNKFGIYTELIIDLLGWGSGLTPSGDDFISGFLLVNTRWRHALRVGRDFREVNKLVVTVADQRTTALSANLIKCAAEGSADERLIRSLDWTLTGKPINHNCAAELLSYGSSSGVDTYAGIALGLIAYKREK